MRRGWAAGWPARDAYHCRSGKRGAGESRELGAGSAALSRHAETGPGLHSVRAGLRSCGAGLRGFGAGLRWWWCFFETKDRILRAPQKPFEKYARKVDLGRFQAKVAPGACSVPNGWPECRYGWASRSEDQASSFKPRLRALRTRLRGFRFVFQKLSWERSRLLDGLVAKPGCP